MRTGAKKLTVAIFTLLTGPLAWAQPLIEAPPPSDLTPPISPVSPQPANQVMAAPPPANQNIAAPPQANLINRSDDDGDVYLPYGRYPHMDGVIRQPKKIESLTKEVQNLSAQVEQTVKDVVAYRNLTCLGDPCQVQAFPIVYTRPDSGFFGGVRARITNISRRNPFLYSVEGYMIRSDSQQWLNYVALDFPAISFLPLQPRIKVRASYARSTETRYFGTGDEFIKDVKSKPDEDLRYGLKERGFQTTLLIPLAKLGPQDIDFASSFTALEHKPARYKERPGSILFQDAPLGIDGGILTRAGVGLFIDSRDREVLSQSGWALEAFYEFSGPSGTEFNFKRITVIDRRFLSAGRFTFANRITVDSAWGKVPFWEFRSVGGIDPIADVSNSQILRGFPTGRFHEKRKIINSAELRYQLDPHRFFGINTDTTLMPIAVDLGKFGVERAIGFSTGAKFHFNKGLLVQLYASVSRDDRSVNLDFGQAF